MYRSMRQDHPGRVRGKRFANRLLRLLRNYCRRCIRGVPVGPPTELAHRNATSDGIVFRVIGSEAEQPLCRFPDAISSEAILAGLERHSVSRCEHDWLLTTRKSAAVQVVRGRHDRPCSPRDDLSVKTAAHRYAIPQGRLSLAQCVGIKLVYTISPADSVKG